MTGALRHAQFIPAGLPRPRRSLSADSNGACVVSRPLPWNGLFFRSVCGAFAAPCCARSLTRTAAATADAALGMLP